MVIFWIKVRRTYQGVSSQADSARENWTWSYPYFNENGRFTLVGNTMAHALMSNEVWQQFSQECSRIYSPGHLGKLVKVMCFK